MPFELLSDDSPAQESPSLGSEILRHGARTGIRAAEQVAGFPGDILSLVNEYIARPVVGALSGQKTQPYEELGISKILPTSEKLRKGNIKQGGKILEPQNKYEKFTDNLINDATSIFLPGKKTGNILKGAGAALVKATGANLAKEAINDLTADQKKGAYAHLGALTLLSFIDKKGAAKAISEGYHPLQQRVTQLNPVSAVKLETNLNNLKTKMMKGTQAPSEKFIIDEVDAVLQKVKNGQISPEEAWAAKRSLNEKLSKVLFEIPQKGTQQRARKLATQISHELDDALKFTQKQDPKFYKELSAWNRAYGTMAESNLVTKWIENNLKYSPLTVGLTHLIGNPISAKASALIAPYEIGKVLYRMSRSPKLAKHYASTMAAASAENVVAFNRQLKILDKELQNDEKHDRFTLIED